MGRDEIVTALTAKIEIRCGLFNVSPQVNIACSLSEEGRQIVRKAAGWVHERVRE